MKSIEKYYENTKNIDPSYTVKKFIKLKIKPEKAIELGCGAGRDTCYLIKNGWKVIAIDKEDVEKIITSKLSEEDRKKISSSIVKNGYFVGNFLGVNDEWKSTRKEMTFLTKDQVKEVFKEFEIIDFKEVEKDALPGLGKIKHWHIFNIIAKKCHE